MKKETYELLWTPATVKGGRVVSQLEDEHDLFDSRASYGMGWEFGDLGINPILGWDPLKHAFISPGIEWSGSIFGMQGHDFGSGYVDIIGIPGLASKSVYKQSL